MKYTVYSLFLLAILSCSSDDGRPDCSELNIISNQDFTCEEQMEMLDCNCES